MKFSGMSDVTLSVSDLTPEQRALLVMRMRRKAASETSSVPPLRPVPRPDDGVVPLSFSQQRLWFMERWQPGSAAYNIPAALRIAGPLDLAALRWAFDEIVRRHEILRVRIDPARPVQVVAPPMPLPIPEVDLAALPEPARHGEAERLIHAEVRRPFDLTGRGGDLLLRKLLLRLGEAEHVAVFNMHHIVSDGWSVAILSQEFATLYTARVQGLPSPLPELPLQYADYAVWQREWLQGEALEAQLAYWRQALDGAPAETALPLARQRPPVRSGHGAQCPYQLDAGTVARLKMLAQREGATLFVVLLAAFDTLLHRYSGETDLVVGSPVAGRGHAELEGLIGFFVNNLALRADLSGDPPFRTLAGRLREVTVAAQAHQDLPFEKLVEELRPERDTSRPPVFQVVFSLQNTPRAQGGLAGLEIAPFGVCGGTAAYDLMVSALEVDGEGVHGFFEYSTDLFDAAAAARLAAGFQTLLAGAAADPGRRLSELPLLAAAERWQLLAEWNDSATEAPQGCFHQVWAERAAGFADAVAVAFEEERLSYGELDRRANLLAHHLQALGVGPEVLVGVAMERSVEMVVAILGVWKAGGAYVPLDPNHPEERLEAVIGETGLLVLVTQERVLPRLPRFFGFSVAVDGEWNAIAGGPAGAPRVEVQPANLAYAIFTSGSTGRPKGVLLPHAGLLHLARAHEALFGTGPGESLLLVAPLVFDAAVFDLVMALWRGNTLWLARQEELLPGPALARILADERITSLTITPSALAALPLPPAADGRSFPALRRLWVAGEACTADLVARWAPGRRFFNAYGPTEATVWVTVEEIGALNEGATPPIGRPVANRRVHVLDPCRQPVPAGAVGELCAAGAGLARGYLDRPELTAERFVPDPFAAEMGEPGARLYRTGDLVKHLPDGRLEFVGRNDRQVKVRGVRIEPGEVEAVLSRHPAVQEAAVVACGEGDGRRLAAFVSPRPGVEPEVPELRAFLRGRLPETLVPSAFTLLPDLPRTANGKLDRRALELIADDGPAGAVGTIGAAAPEGGGREAWTPAEELAAGILAGVLGVPRLGLDDGFFDLGGHSLLATQVLSRVRETFGVEVPLADFFEQPTARGLAARCTAALAAGLVPVPPLLPVDGASRQGELPLSFAQQRLWFLQQLEPGSTVYNIPGGVRLRGRLDLPALAGSLGEIVRRHEVLRTTFPAAPAATGRPVQVIAPWRPLAIPLIDLAPLPAAARDEEARRLARDEARRPFDLARGPLLRLSLLHLAPDDHALLFTMHHIVSDGWSMGVLIGELARLYPAAVAGVPGGPSPLPELPVQYADFAAWQRRWLQGAVLESQLAYWKERLAGLPPLLELPADRPRPAVPSGLGRRLSFSLEEPVSDAVRRLSRDRGATLFMTLLAGFQALLARLSGQDDFAVGTPIAGRNRVEIEGLIGFFVNTLVLRADILRAGREGEPAFSDLLARVRETALGAYAHQDLPFEQLVEELRPERTLARTPLFQVMFALQNAPMGALDLPGLALEPLGVEPGTARFDLTVEMMEGEAGLHGQAEHSTDLFDAATVERLLAGLGTLLAAACAAPEAPLRDLPLLAAAERQQLLVDWNDTAADWPRDLCVHQVFAARAAATPDAPALENVAGDERFTYAELERRANRLARHLAAMGVGPEVTVGLCLPRSPEAVLAMLAVLKAGGAYLPLDPEHPAERTALLLRETAAPVVLARGETADRLPVTEDCRVVRLDEAWPAIERLSPAPLPAHPGASPGSLAYVLFTSGSTGRPKGVRVEHRAILRLVLVGGYATFGSGETFLQLAPLAFDAATFEVWGALLHGSRLVVMPAGAPSLEELGRAVASRGVTTLWLTAGLFHQMVDGPVESLRGVRQLLAGGDALSASHVRRALSALPGTRLINGYGPTEGTTFTACHVLSAEDPAGGPVPIGRPIAGTRVYVLDRRLVPVPTGVAGELYIGGDGLARDYLGEPALTAERFVPDAWSGASSGQPGERLYRTGDRVRWLPGGLLQFLGRTDRQVKVRGFRVEPGEVEAALAAHPGVREAAVLALDEAAGGKRLAACVVPAAASAPPAAALRSFLRERLPDAMVPSVVFSLPALPLTANGKVDLRALARLVPGGDAARPDVAMGRAADLAGAARSPRGEMEEMMEAIWCEVLDRRRIGPDEDFFDLGGHSLLAAQVVSRVRTAFGVELPLRSLFEAPTVAGLARQAGAALRAAEGLEPPIRPVPREEGGEGGLPLSFAQERLWFLEQLQPGTATYNVVTAVFLDGLLDVAAFARALGTVVERHEALRTRFVHAGGAGYGAGGQPVQVIDPPPVWALPVADLSALPAAGREAVAQAVVDAESRRPFDLAAGPVLRPLLLRLSPERHVALLAMHHIVSDAWSVSILVGEMAELYTAYAAGEPSPLAPLAIQYADFAAWQRRWLAGAVLERQLDFWRHRLAGAPAAMALPLDRPRPPVQSFRGDKQTLSLDAAVTRELQALSRRSGTTLFMTLLAAFDALLHRWTGDGDLVVGTPSANRNREEIEGLIGFFINSLALRVDLSGDPDAAALLARVRETTLAAYTHQDLPFEKIVAELKTERDLSYTPLFQVMFQLQNAATSALDLPGLTLRFPEVETRTAKFDLIVNFHESPAGLGSEWRYNVELFDAATILRLTRQFAVLAAGIAAEPQRPVTELPWLTEAERHQTVVEWNDHRTPAAARPEVCFPELFQEQAAIRPDAVAVACEGEHVSYAELDRRSEAAARLLAGRGIGPDSVVGLLARRSPGLLTAILAIQKAGGAWMPLDPAQPAARLERMIAGSGAGLVLIGKGIAPPAAALATTAFLPLAELLTAPPSPEPLPVRLQPENMAYLIYTSGSTGVPKGVMVEHRGMLNHLLSKVSYLEMTAADVVAQNASHTFDISVWQLLAALLVGGRVQIFPGEVALDPARLYEGVDRERVTIFELVPSVLRAVCEIAEGTAGAGGPGLSALRWLIPTGEALPPDLGRRWLELHPGIPVVNAYGPTECSDDVSHHVLRTAPPPSMVVTPIGRPTLNLRLQVLDRGFRPVPIGVAGELCIAGVGVGRGYRYDPARTAEAFVPDPLASVAGGAGEPGARLYRTGDLARFLPDGSLEYLGRRDRQVKIRGFRIETGEIEVALRSHPGVRETAVLARSLAGAAALSLVAYVVPRRGGDGGDGGDGADAAGLRAFLAERLPEYMVPAVFVELAALPLSPNGKLDVRALPEPRQEEVTGAVPAVPRTPLEEEIAAVWQEVLGVERFGVHDNFFELGGDSIKGAILMHRLQRRLGEVLYVVTLFDAPTVAGLAAHLEEHYPAAVARLVGETAGEMSGEAARPAAPAVRIGDAEVAALRRLIPSLPPLPGAAAEAKNPPAVFVLSPPRSGSTLLRVLLGGHPGLFAPPELELLSFRTLAERRAAFTGRDAFWLEGLLRALVQVLGIGPEEARALMAEHERQDLSTRRFYGLLQGWLGDRMLVDKTPSYALDPAALRRAEEGFAGARYIHLVRHPSAAVRSFEEAHLDRVFFRREHPFTARQLGELIWTVSQQNILAFLADVPAERRHRVVFEDLVRQPRPVLEGICDFLGIPFHPGMESPYDAPASRMTDGLHDVSRMLGDVKFHEHRRIEAAVAERWRRSASAAELGEPTRRVALALGYDLEGERRTAEPVPPDRRLAPVERRDWSRETPPLSFAQERLWFLHLLDPEGGVYNMPNAFRLRGPLDRGALDRALCEVLRRHETLRTRFAVRDGLPVPVVEPAPESLLAMADLAALPEAARDGEARRLFAAEAARPFDLARGPVVRSLLLRLASEEHGVLFVAHHIACDGWSMGLWAREIEALYAALAAGRPSPLPEPPVQYADFAHWQRSWLDGEELAAEVEHWRQRLAGAPPYLDLPTDRPRPPVQTFRGAWEMLALPAGLAADLRTLARRHNASLFMVLLAGFQLLLSRLSGQDDVLVGSPIAGRVPEVEGLIGCFLNTLVLRGDLSGSPSFSELIGRVRETALDAFAHQDVPYEKLLEVLRPERDLSRNSLFQVLFNMLNAPAAEVRLPGVDLEGEGLAEAASKFDLTLYVAERGEDLLLNLVYNADLFDRSRIQEMLRQYQALLTQAVGDPEAPVAGWSLLTPEAAAVLPDPAAALPGRWEGTVHDLFGEWAARRPDKVALADRDGEWTYGELDGAVRRLAVHLIAGGIQPGDRVAIYAHRSAALAWALLGILKAGAAFVILDPIYPGARLVEVLRLARPAGWLRLEGAGPLPEPLAAYVAAAPFRVRLDVPAGGPKAVLEAVGDPPQPDSWPDVWPAPGPDDVASHAFTSGSTGVPKGIVQTHGSMSFFLPWHREVLGYGEADRHTMLSGLAHDPLQRDVFYALGSGATLCVPDPGRIGEPGYLAAWMRRERVTVTNLTPAMAQLVTEGESAALPDLRCAVLAGDILTRLDVHRIRRLAPQARLLNVYGATESQRALSYHLIGEADERGKQVLPLGRGKRGCQLLVLTASGERAGIGELGEVAIRSRHLAAGYLEDDALTRERFVPNPFAADPADRLYRTGDLGRYRPDGEVEAAGRADQQVKIRGYRVEPGEIEAELGRIPGVREAVVVGRDDPAGPVGGKRLVAYVVLDSVDIGEAELRELLRERLPAYMVPAVFVALDRLPLNPNGKVDRRALPEPPSQPGLLAERQSVPPRDELERSLVRIWEEVLGTGPVGVTDGFFELGGHSLLAVRLTARIAAELGQALPLAALFQAPTVEQMAALLRRKAPVEDAALVPLRTAGRRPPLFLVHPAGGQVFSYTELVRCLGTDQPVYGLQDTAPADAPRTLAGLAARYLREVRAVQPHGPYLLAGWSFGGRVAFEMARQLETTGEEVALLGMLDTGLVQPPATVQSDAELLAEVVGELPLSMDELRQADDPLAALIERARQAGALAPDITLEAARHLLDLFKAHLEVARTDRPQPYGGKVVFFAAEIQPQETAADPSHGWSGLARELELRRVPGDHVTMIHHPEKLQVVAQQLAAVIEEALAEMAAVAG